MKLIIYSPEKTVFEGEVSLCEVPGTKGRFTVLKDHDSIISTLTAGNIRYRVEEDQDVLQPIKSGYVEVHNNIISVCVHL